MAQQKHIIEVGKSIYHLKSTPFDPEVDMDDLTRIHYDNLVGEVLTIATLMNKVGILKADVDNEYREQGLKVKILEAERAEYYRDGLTTNNGKTTKKPTIAEVDNAVVTDPEVQDLRRELLRMQKQAEQIDSLYWAVKSKEMKLNKFAENITPEDFENEIIEGSINSVMIKKTKKTF